MKKLSFICEEFSSLIFVVGAVVILNILPWILIILVLVGMAYIIYTKGITFFLLLIVGILALLAVLLILSVVYELWSTRKERASRNQLFERMEMIDFATAPETYYSNYSIEKLSYLPSLWKFNANDLKLEEFAPQKFKLSWKDPDDKRNVSLVLDYLVRSNTKFGPKDAAIYSFDTLFVDKAHGFTYVQSIKYHERYITGGAIDYYPIEAGWSKGCEKLDPATLQFI